MNDKPIKCWYCARLGKCQKRKPCKAFRRYPYPTGAPEREYTLPKVAELCGVHSDTLAKKLRRETDAALAFIY